MATIIVANGVMAMTNNGNGVINNMTGNGWLSVIMTMAKRININQSFFFQWRNQ
jgi:hypothetical protein